MTCSIPRENKKQKGLRLKARMRMHSAGALAKTPLRFDTSSGYRISRIAAPSRRGEPRQWLVYSTLQLPSPDTAAGPPRIQTVFRFVEPNGGRIFPECVQGVKRGVAERVSVREFIFQKFNISLSVASVGSLLAELNLMPQKTFRLAQQLLSLQSACDCPAADRRARRLRISATASCRSSGFPVCSIALRSRRHIF